MAQGLNRATFIGHLGRAPEMRYTPTGKPVTSFSVITDYTWSSSDGERHYDSDWFNIVVWGELAETCKESLSKGQRVYVEGRVKNRRWIEADNTECARAELVAQSVIALDHP